MQTLNPEQELAIMKKLLKKQMKESHTPLEEFGPELKDVAASIGEKPEDVAIVLIPLYKEAVDETLEDGALLALIERGWQGHRRGGN